MDDDLSTGDAVPSAELVDHLDETGEAVISLDGTTLTHDEVEGVREALANEVPADLIPS